MQFYEYPPKPWTELLSDCEDSARDLVSKLVVYESSQRLTATEVSSAKAIEGFFVYAFDTRRHFVTTTSRARLEYNSATGIGLISGQHQQLKQAGVA